MKAMLIGFIHTEGRKRNEGRKGFNVEKRKRDNSWMKENGVLFLAVGFQLAKGIES